MAELWSLPATELARIVRTRELSAEEVCRVFLDRAATVDACTNCFVALESEPALAAARATDRRLGTGGAPALAGVPYAAKDIFVTADGAPGAGARRMGLQLRAESSTVLDRLNRAGATRLGRLNLDPWAYAATGANSELGDTRNPWNLERLAGGSSSGSAAAVAARAVPFALGADTGGSIRIPAALCGVTGLKPTFGRVSRWGALPLSYSQDAIGVLASSATDVAFVLQQVAGYDPLDPASIQAPVPPYLAEVERIAVGVENSLVGTRLGVDWGWLEQTCDQPVSTLAGASLAVLARAGASIVDVDLSALAHYDVAASVLTQAESMSVHRGLIRDRPDDYPPATRARVHAGIACQGSDHVDALRYQGYALRELLDGPLSQADVLAAPVAGRTAPARADLDGLDEAQAVQLSVELLSLNRPFSLVGVPALSLPIGFAADGLPVGLQLVGRPWAEPALLGMGAAYQAVTDWHRKIPEPGLQSSPMIVEND